MTRNIYGIANCIKVLFPEDKSRFRLRRSMSEAERITELAAASRYQLSIPQYRAKLKRERKERIKQAKRRYRALNDTSTREEDKESSPPKNVRPVDRGPNGYKGRFDY